MKHFVIRILSLIFGLFLFALAVVLAIKANIGYAPWDVFHVGLAHKVGLSIGVASILTGFIVVVVVIILGEKIGLGTVCNIILIGVYMDIILMLDIIPMQETLVSGIIMLIIGLLVMSIGTYFYIRAGFGAGPRDSLMVALNRKTRIPIGICRSVVELLATVSGWLLGGMVGPGTVISVVAIGFFIQATFAVFRFVPASIKHETLYQTYKRLRGQQSDDFL
jgi:uncharacterized membrane protein YczE